MCGELDEATVINREILDRFCVLSKKLGVSPRASKREFAEDLSLAESRATLMQELFTENLAGALGDVIAAGEENTVDVVASQAIAMARLAGFIAGQLPPEADLFRSVIEAMSEGYAQPRHLLEVSRHEHDHHHGPDEGHHTHPHSH